MLAILTAVAIAAGAPGWSAATRGAPEATVILAQGAEPPHTGKGCPKPGSVRSPKSSAKTNVTFANSTGRTIQIYWIDFDGNWNYYRELKNGQDYQQPTYVGHAWVAVDMKDRCVGGVFKAAGGPNTAEYFGD